MNVNLNLNGLLFNRPFAGPVMKSTQDKMERQQQCQNKIDFYENQITALKGTNCETLEDISRKLDLFHSYQNGITAAKKQYNHEQMFKTLEEAKERGEKIAEAAEKMEPKTAEERKEEMVSEALGTEEEKSELMESLEELTDNMEELTDDLDELIDSMEELSKEEEAMKEKAEIEMLEEQAIVEDASEDAASKAEAQPTVEGQMKQDNQLALLEYYKNHKYEQLNYYV